MEKVWKKLEHFSFPTDDNSVFNLQFKRLYINFMNIYKYFLSSPENN